METDDAQALLTLLALRYLPGDDAHPRRGYAYVRGPLQLYRGEPEMVVESVGQVTDVPPGATTATGSEATTVRLPDRATPVG